MSPGWALLVGLGLLGANAFFVGAEFAIMSARRSAIEPLAEAGHRWAVTVLWAMERVSLMLATAQLGVTVCSTSLGVVAEPAIAELVTGPAEAFGLSEEFSHTIAFVIALTVVVFAHVVLGEMVPKNLAVAGPERAVRWFGPPLVAVAKVLGPVVGVMNRMANGLLSVVGVRTVDEVNSAYTADEVQSIVEHSAAEGTINDDHGLIAGALEFSDRSAGDVMVPWAHLVTVPSWVTPEEVERLVATTGYSRFPVLVDSEAVGYLHLKDVLYADGAERSIPVPGWRVRQMVAVSPDDQVEQALAAMQAGASHLARVDEEGRCVGVVFLEDVLEELVGEVRDVMQRSPNTKRIPRSHDVM